MKIKLLLLLSIFTILNHFSFSQEIEFQELDGTWVIEKVYNISKEQYYDSEAINKISGKKEGTLIKLTFGCYAGDDFCYYYMTEGTELLKFSIQEGKSFLENKKLILKWESEELHSDKTIKHEASFNIVELTSDKLILKENNDENIVYYIKE